MCLPVEICCFCAKLEVGAKILGVVHVVLSTVIAIVYGAVAATVSYLPSSRRLFYALVSAAAVGMLVLSCLMTYGAFKRKPKYLLAWVMMTWFWSVLLVGMAIMGTVLLTFSIDGNSSSEISVMISVYLIYGVSLYYSVSVVNSRRVEMVREDQTEASLRLMRQRDLPKSLIVKEDVV